MTIVVELFGAIVCKCDLSCSALTAALLFASCHAALHVCFDCKGVLPIYADKVYVCSSFNTELCRVASTGRKA